MKVIAGAPVVVGTLHPGSPVVVSPGTPGFAGGFEHEQTSPAATWTIPHSLGRRPAVSVWIGDELVDTDVTATDVNVTVSFPAPTAGTVVLT